MKRIKTLTALISASLTSHANTNQDAVIIGAMMDTLDNNNISNISVLNKSVSHRLAAHRSHGSHRSHRSGSGGGYSRPAPTYTAPKPSKPAPLYSAPKPSSSSYSISTHDPLGQQARPAKSYPTETKKPKGTKADVKKIIMQVQMALLLEGLYEGKIDGIMGASTRKAIKKFKKKNNITSKALLGADTLNALGVRGF